MWAASAERQVEKSFRPIRPRGDDYDTDNVNNNDDYNVNDYDDDNVNDYDDDNVKDYDDDNVNDYYLSASSILGRWLW